MEASEIVRAIERRRAELWDRQIAGSGDDPLVYSETSLVRAIADVLGRLLSAIRECQEAETRKKVERDQSKINDLSEYYSALVEP